MRIRLLILLAAVCSMTALTACGGGSGTQYDISPIFPLTEGKCAEYHGTEEGSGFTASCMVTKDECERAAADWHEAMESSGIAEPIEFSCD